jgi:hypothetical protein
MLERESSFFFAIDLQLVHTDSRRILQFSKKVKYAYPESTHPENTAPQTHTAKMQRKRENGVIRR